MIQAFFIAFAFSFIGSIPPGSINLSVLQLAIDRRFKAALRFALAAALIEFPYAFIAVKFQGYLLSSPLIMDNLKLIAAVVMLVLGVINIYTSNKDANSTLKKLQDSGFRKGLIISILNPLAIPFWIGVTAYLSSINWIELKNTNYIFWYVAGVSAGTFALLALLAILGQKVSHLFKKSQLIHSIPGVVFLILGTYALLQYFNLL